MTWTTFIRIVLLDQLYRRCCCGIRCATSQLTQYLTVRGVFQFATCSQMTIAPQGLRVGLIVLGIYNKK